MRRIALLAALFMLALTPAHSQWLFHGGIANGSAPQTIATVNLSNSNFTGGIANGVVGAITVTMTPASPSFTGSLSLTGANSGGFQISGGNLTQSSGGTANGTYTDVNIVATQGGISNSPQHISPTLVGTTSTASLACDLTPSGCFMALSVAEQLVSAYSGPAFQLYRMSDATTHDVAFVSGIPNMADAFSFCKNTFCVYTKVYNQASTGSSNDVIASQFDTIDGFTCSSSTIMCAPPFWIDATNNLPVIPTMDPAAMEVFAGLSGSTVGFPSPTGAKSVFVKERSEDNTPCCATTGIMEQTTVAPGTMFALTSIYGIAVPPSSVNCGAATENCEFIDVEGAGFGDGAGGTNVTAPVYMEGQYDGTGSGASTKLYVNNTLHLTGAFPTTVDSGSWWRIGAAGDHTHGSQRVQTTWGTTEAGNHAAARAAEQTFFGGRSPSTCAGPVDLYNPLQNYTGQNSVYFMPSGGSYALRLLRAGYTGPIADLRNTLGTVNTYGRDPSGGCIIDPAAATFCAANGPCTVQCLYDQSGHALTGGGQQNVDPNLVNKACDLTSADQPTANFANLNGLPTMHFNGTSQWLQSAGFAGWREPWTVMAVARRSSGTSQSTIASFDQGFGLLSATTANTAQGKSTDASDPSAISGTCSDTHWHMYSFTSANGTGSQLWCDNVSVGTTSSQGSQTLMGYIGIGGDPGGGLGYWTGDIAEIDLMYGIQGGTNVDPTSQLFTNYEAAWGSLPN